MGLISQTVFNGGCHVLGYHLLSFISLRLIFAPLLAAIRKSGNDIYTCSCFVCIE